MQKIKSESLWENNGRQRSKISESPSRLKHYCIVIWHFQYNRYIRKLHLSCIDHYDSHVLWKTVNIWRQIPYKYWSLLLISGSFECREVFLSQIYSVVSWRSSGWSDTVKKSKAFGGSQKWTFESQQSKLSEKKSQNRTFIGKYGGATCAWGGAGWTEQKNESLGWSGSACYEVNKVYIETEMMSMNVYFS